MLHPIHDSALRNLAHQIQQLKNTITLSNADQAERDETTIKIESMQSQLGQILSITGQTLGTIDASTRRRGEKMIDMNPETKRNLYADCVLYDLLCGALYVNPRNQE